MVCLNVGQCSPGVLELHTKLEKFPQILLSQILGFDILPPGNLSLTTSTEPNALYSVLSESSALVPM